MNQVLLLIIFASLGCSPAGYSPQKVTKDVKPSINIKFEQGLSLINNVYTLVVKNYVDPVSCYKLLIDAVKGIESKVGKTNLFFKGTETDVVISPITQIPYDTAISVKQTHNAIIEIYRFVVNNYPDYSPTELSSALLNGMLHGLDSHSSLLSPDDFKSLVNTHDEFTGIGVNIAMRNGFVTVISAIEGTPAYKAGIKSRDKIIRVNGKATRDLREAVKGIQGIRGTEVVVTITRKESKEPIDFKMIRDNIPANTIKAIVLKPGYGYIRITSFGENTTDDFVSELEKLESAKIPFKGLILDLRDNPGGLLNQAIKVSDLFLEKGIIVSIKGRNKKNIQIYKATPNKVKRDYPIALLINGGSAGASEIVAGALHDLKRALILGSISFGKGSLQLVQKVGDGYGVRLTTARYFTPNEKVIQERGIVPDILLDHIGKKDLADHCETKPIDGEKNKPGPIVKRLFSDNQIHQAYRILKKAYTRSHISTMPGVWEEDLYE